MNQSLPDPFIFRQLSFMVILLMLWVIITITLKISFRMGKLIAPSLRVLFGIGFLQVLIGSTTLFILEKIQEKDTVFVFWGSLGMVFLSGLLIIKTNLNLNWKQTIRIWAISTSMQLVFIPVCLVAMWAGYVIIGILIYPPQF